MSSAYDSTIALVTTTSMSEYFGIAASSSEEEEMDNVINAVSRYVVECTGRYETSSMTLLSTSRTGYYDGDNTDTLYLRAYPITAVTSIHIDDSTPRDWATGDLVDSDEYLIYQDEGKVVLDGNIYVGGKRNVKVVYTAGYTTVPYDLQQAVKELVAFWYQRGTGKRVAVRSVNVGDKSTSYESDIPKAVQSVLDRYKNMSRWVA